MTSTKTILTTILLVAFPAIASATCPFGGHDQVTMTCIDGATWDPVTRTCISPTG